MQTYIGRLTDRGSLSEPIVWRTTSIAEARELLVNVGSWQSSPDTGDAMLLSDSAFVDIFIDEPPFNVADDLAQRVEDRMPHLTFSVGPRGGIRRNAH